jgi:hypothetical protein
MQISTLVTVEFFDNRLIGPLPTGISPSIRTMSVSVDFFFPCFWTVLKTYTVFILDKKFYMYSAFQINQINGSIPQEYYESRTTVNLFSNRLTGPLPTSVADPQLDTLCGPPLPRALSCYFLFFSFFKYVLLERAE